MAFFAITLAYQSVKRFHGYGGGGGGGEGGGGGAGELQQCKNAFLLRAGPD